MRDDKCACLDVLSVCRIADRLRGPRTDNRQRRGETRTVLRPTTRRGPAKAEWELSLCPPRGPRQGCVYLRQWPQQSPGQAPSPIYNQGTGRGGSTCRGPSAECRAPAPHPVTGETPAQQLLPVPTLNGDGHPGQPEQLFPPAGRPAAAERNLQPCRRSGAEQTALQRLWNGLPSVPVLLPP